MGTDNTLAQIPTTDHRLARRQQQRGRYSSTHTSTHTHTCTGVKFSIPRALSAATVLGSTSFSSTGHAPSSPTSTKETCWSPFNTLLAAAVAVSPYLPLAAPNSPLYDMRCCAGGAWPPGGEPQPCAGCARDAGGALAAELPPAVPPPEYLCGGAELAPGPSKSSKLRSSRSLFCFAAGAAAAGGGAPAAAPRRESRSWPRTAAVFLALEAGFAFESCRGGAGGV